MDRKEKKTAKDVFEVPVSKLISGSGPLVVRSKKKIQRQKTAGLKQQRAQISRHRGAGGAWVRNSALLGGILGVGRTFKGRGDLAIWQFVDVAIRQFRNKTKLVRFCVLG